MNIDLFPIFARLVGSHVWNGTRSFGTYLTFEFGSPHIRFREPKIATDTGYPKVDRSFHRRKVELTGDWSLWLQECDWDLSFRGVSLSSEQIGRRSTDADLGDLHELLTDIDGQKLIEVACNEANREVALHLDLGGIIQFRKSSQSEGPQWSLYAGHTLICEESGEIK